MRIERAKNRVYAQDEAGREAYEKAREDMEKLAAMLDLLAAQSPIGSRRFRDGYSRGVVQSVNLRVARFRIGKSVYDKRAEKERRWINLNVKAFGDVCARISKMRLDSGSFIHIEGRYDEDVWDDDSGKHCVPVVILTDVEYAYSGNGNGNGNCNSNGNGNASGNAKQNGKGKPGAQNGTDEMPGSFTGFENYGGANPFFPQE